MRTQRDIRAILDNPYYQVLRNEFGRPASAALKAVRWYEQFVADLNADDEEEKEKEEAT